MGTGLPSSSCTVTSREFAVQWDPPRPTTAGQEGEPGSPAVLQEAEGDGPSGSSRPREVWPERTETVVTPQALLFHVSSWTRSSCEWKSENDLWIVAKRHLMSHRRCGDGSVLRGQGRRW